MELSVRLTFGMVRMIFDISRVIGFLRILFAVMVETLGVCKFCSAAVTIIVSLCEIGVSVGFCVCVIL